MDTGRKARGIGLVAFGGLALAASVSAVPAAAAPKPAELTIAASPVGDYPGTGPCGLWLTADYTGGKGKYTLTVELSWLDDGLVVRSEPSSERSIRRSADPATLERTSAASAVNRGADQVRVEATLSDRKGTVDASVQTFDLLPDCP